MPFFKLVQAKQSGDALFQHKLAIANHQWSVGPS